MIKSGDDVVSEFRGDHEFLSNFYPSILIVSGESYPSVEHAFQAAKTDDLALKESIREASTAGEAKKLGRSVPLVQDWDQKRLDVMASLIKQKFSDHLDLKLRLLLTGEKELIEGNTWRDQFWGQTKDGIGENHLGKILMTVRANLRANEGSPLQVLTKFLENNNIGFLGEKIKDLVEIADVVANQDTSVLDKTAISDFLKILT